MLPNVEHSKVRMEISEEDRENYEETVSWSEAGRPLEKRWGTLTQLRDRYGLDHPDLPELKTLCQAASIEIELETNMVTAIAAAGGDGAREFEGQVGVLWRTIEKVGKSATIGIRQSAARFLNLSPGTVDVRIVKGRLINTMEQHLRERISGLVVALATSNGLWQSYANHIERAYVALDAQLPASHANTLFLDDRKFVQQLSEREIDVRAQLEAVSRKDWGEQAKLVDTVRGWVVHGTAEVALANLVTQQMAVVAEPGPIKAQLSRFGKLVAAHITGASPRSNPSGWNRACAEMLLALTDRLASSERLLSSATALKKAADQYDGSLQFQGSIVLDTLAPHLRTLWQSAAAALAPAIQALHDTRAELAGFEALLPAALPTGDEAAWEVWLDESKVRLDTLLKRCGRTDSKPAVDKAFAVAAHDIGAWGARVKLGPAICSWIDDQQGDWSEQSWQALFKLVKTHHPALGAALAPVKAVLAVGGDWSEIHPCLRKVSVDYEDAAAYLIAQNGAWSRHVGQALFKAVLNETPGTLGWWLKIFGLQSAHWTAFTSYCETLFSVRSQQDVRQFDRISSDSLGRLLRLRQSVYQAELAEETRRGLARYDSVGGFERLAELRWNLIAKLSGRYTVGLALRLVPLGPGTGEYFSPIPQSAEGRNYLSDKWNELIFAAAEFHERCLALVPLARLLQKNKNARIFLSSSLDVSPEYLRHFDGAPTETEIVQAAKAFLNAARGFEDATVVRDAVSSRLAQVGALLLSPTIQPGAHQRKADLSYAPNLADKLPIAIEANIVAPHQPTDALSFVQDVLWFRSQVSGLLSQESRSALRVIAQTGTDSVELLQKLEAALTTDIGNAELARWLVEGHTYCQERPESSLEKYLHAVVRRAIEGIVQQYGDAAHRGLCIMVVQAVGRERLRTALTALQRLYPADLSAKRIASYLFS